MNGPSVFHTNKIIIKKNCQRALKLWKYSMCLLLLRDEINFYSFIFLTKQDANQLKFSKPVRADMPAVVTRIPLETVLESNHG